MTPPNTVKLAAVAWSGAIAAGVVEAAIAVTRLAAEGPLTGPIWLNLGLRVVVFAVAAALIVGLVRGSRAARIALTALLSVLGLASLVVPAVLQLAQGGTLYAALDEFGAVRVVHVLLVIVATIVMYLPSANAYFRRGRGVRAPVGANPIG
ncbi:hypothetical protein [Agromyces sp. NPDC049794]|uniref:hypothetical protein n=1 Tax=unclassified Agromyces TaxID=2639701 RepID=UPI0033F7E387